MAALVSTERLARASAAHPWRTVLAWLLALLVAGALIVGFLGDALTSESDFTNTPESKAASLLIDERLPAQDGIDELVLVRHAGATVDDPAFRERVAAVEQALAPYGTTSSYLSGDEEGIVSPDRDTTIVTLTLNDTSDERVEQLVDEVRALDGTDGFTTAITGVFSSDADFRQVAESDLQRGEVFGIGIALIVLLAVFGALVASLIPIILAVISITVALGLTALVGQAFELSFFVVNMLVMMGLAVGIDYALFSVSRFREERDRGRSKLDAIRVTGATANRAVMLSGVTVVLALLGMLLVPTTIFRSLAIGAILAVLVAVVGAVTLLPALLALLGDRVDRLRLPLLGRRAPADHADRGVWARIARGVMRRPVVSLVGSVAILLAAASPFLDINTGFAGISTLPDSFQSKQGFVLLDEEFGYGDTSPVQVVVDGDASSQAVQNGVASLQERFAADERFGLTDLLISPRGDLTLLTAQLAGDPSSEAASTAVQELRDEYVPQAFGAIADDVYVGGITAENVDFFELTDQYLPIVIAFVLGLSFLLLAVAFRSIVVPATSIVMNLLSVGAAYGLLVLVFQKGWLAGLFGFQQVDTIEAWIPLFLFSVLFGLSMDYHVFLLSRIRERFDRTQDNTDSIVYGVGTTARIITGAALIMVAVFGGFASGELVMFQQMGFGLGVAVLLDATIIRSVLVPATMRLLGRWNWFLPRKLEWLPRVAVEGPAEVAPER